METTRTKTTDIMDIAKALDGKVSFTSIKFSQVLSCKHGENINHLKFIKKAHGVYFYTNIADIEKAVCCLLSVPLVTLVVCESSKNMYEIK